MWERGQGRNTEILWMVALSADLIWTHVHSCKHTITSKFSTSKADDSRDHRKNTKKEVNM